MKSLIIPVEWKGKTMHADLSDCYCIAIPLDHTPQITQISQIERK